MSDSVLQQTTENVHAETAKEKPSIVNKIFDLRGKFAIIGLTGRTGSGCSTVANILSTKLFDNLALPKPTYNGDELTNNDRKYQICYDYLQQNWTQAIPIKATHIIIWSCLLFDFNDFIQKLNQVFDESIKDEKDESKKKRFQKGKSILTKHHAIFCKKYQSISSEALSQFNQLNKKHYKEDTPDKDKEIAKTFTFFNSTLPNYCNSLKNNIKRDDLSSVEIFQILGNFIREIRENDNSKKSIIELINLLIKFYRFYYGEYKKNDNAKKTKKIIIVIDALRNPYEILFLRERYSAFYVISVNTTEEERQRRLFKKSYSNEQVEECDRTEYPQKPALRDIYLRQNIERCNEISDIHLVNNFSQSNNIPQELTKQIAHYMSLILHPGLVPPSNEERTMQIAYTAKYNSGCLSRQVGAVITDEQFAIKAIGWNDVPEGQTPCILRNSQHIINHQADALAYSDYELYNSGFQETLKNTMKATYDLDKKRKILKGRHVPYCFKDIYNKQIFNIKLKEIQGQIKIQLNSLYNNSQDQQDKTVQAIMNCLENNSFPKNQVHTRSLHAEENAFLQISKYGGQGIRGGKLFTTASPCELCSKKAYQLGIKEIYYIDLYPGISKKHILENGRFRPKMKLFQGAIGRAYIHLYQPILSYKDEIQELLNPTR